MIYVIEGPDGTGKTTLSKAIAEKVGGEILHPGFNKKWNIEKYHKAFFKLATEFDEMGIPTILDRWAPSEHVYASVFRGGESYDTDALIKKLGADVVWIYCRNDNAVANHFKNQTIRKEMFDDMTEVVKAFDQYVSESPLDWRMYDYDKVDMNKFVEELPS